MRAARIIVLLALWMGAGSLAGCPRRYPPATPPPDHFAACLQEAWEALMENRLAESQRLLSACADEGEAAHSARALWLAGIAAVLQANFPSAAKYFLQALRLAPGSPEALAAVEGLDDLRGMLAGMPERLTQAATELSQGHRPEPAACESLQALSFSACLEEEMAGHTGEVQRLRRYGGAVPVWRRVAFFRGHQLLLFEQALSGWLPPPAAYRPLVYAPCGLLHIDSDGRPGLFVARTNFVLERKPGGGPAPARVWLLMESDSPLLLRLDGAVILAHESHRHSLPARRRLLLELQPGSHELLLAVAAETTARGSFFLLPREADVIKWRGDGDSYDRHSDGRTPVVAEPPEPAELVLQQGADPPGRLLAALLFWRDGRLDAARSLLQWLVAAYPRSAVIRYLLALVLLDDPALPPPVDRARARSHLRVAAAAAQAPLAKLRLALSLDSLDTDPMPAIELLRQAETTYPDVFLWPLHQGRLLERAGLESDAWRSCKRAFDLQPELAEVQQELFRLAVSSHAAREAQVLAERLERSGRYAAVTPFWRGRGDFSKTVRLLELEAGRSPDRAGPLLELADVLLEANERERALECLQQALGRERDVRAVLQRAANLFDLAGESQEAEKLLQELVRLQPHRPAYHLMHAVHAGASRVSIPGETPVDTAQWIAEAMRLEAPPQAPALRVLDQATQWVFPGGESLTRLHLLIRVLSAEGVAKWGELESPPPEALVEALRTIKADGRIFYAENLPGKETVSLPQLQPGDFVEVKFLSGSAAPAIGPAGRGWTSGSWYFASQDEPILLSRFGLALPAELDWRARMTRGAPEPQVREEQGLRLIVWEARNIERWPEENGAPAPDEIFPAVVVAAGMGWPDVRAALAAELGLAARVDDGLRRLAFDIAGGPRAGEEGLRRLFRWVASQVRQKGGGDDFSETAGHVLARREGNRLVALYALVRALGFEARPLLARPLEAPPPDELVPQSGIFTAPVLKVELGGRTLWLTPRRRYQPFGQLDEALYGQPALDLSGRADGGPTFSPLPPPPPERPGHQILLQLELEAGGGLRGRGQEIFEPLPAAEFREALEPLPEPRRRQLLEAGLADSFPGALLAGSRLVGLDRPDEPLQVLFNFRVPGALQRSEAGLFLPGEIFPYRLAGRFPLASRRRLPLLIAEPLRISTHIDLKLPAGWRAEPPAAVEWEAPLSRFSYRAEQRGAVLHIEKKVAIEPGRIPPEAVEPFRSFCHRVGRLESSPLAVKAKPVP